MSQTVPRLSKRRRNGRTGSQPLTLPIYGLRNTPKTIQEAVPILGQKALRRILLTAGTQALCIGHTGASAASWNHAMATSLAAEGFARKVRFSGGSHARHRADGTPPE